MHSSDHKPFFAFLALCFVVLIHVDSKASSLDWNTSRYTQYFISTPFSRKISNREDQLGVSYGLHFLYIEIPNKTPLLNHIVHKVGIKSP